MFLFDFFSRHKRLLWSVLALLIVVLAICSSRLRLTEDIAEFLPLSERNQQAMDMYLRFSDADRIIVIFEDTTAQPDSLVAAVDDFQAACGDDLQVTTRIDMQRYLDCISMMYTNAAYFLMPQDYAQMDSLLDTPDYVNKQMASNHEQLLMPLSSFSVQRIQADPLNFYSRIVNGLRSYQPTTGGFESYDGYMLTSDQKMAFAYLTSPYGSSETKQNALLIDSLQQRVNQVMNLHPTVQARLLGSPVIAVGNANRIKKDTVWVLLLSLVLIVVLLTRTFRNPRGILLILLTVAFGWLFAVAVVSLWCGQVSLIVLGIGSVIIGIAVNYPLHVVVHRSYTPDARTNLKEVIAPLVIGNITTVAAFLTLVPLPANALRDLGVFAASLLVGTILFSVIWLPHLLPCEYKTQKSSSRVLRCLSEADWYKNKYLLISMALLTLVLGFFAPHLQFDSNISNINYMTEQQRADFAYFAHMRGQEKNEQTIYLTHEGCSWEERAQCAEHDKPLIDSLQGEGFITNYRSATDYLPSQQEQQRRIQQWQSFWSRHRDQVATQLRTAALNEDFDPTAFDSFLQSIDSIYQPQDSSFFSELQDAVFPVYSRSDVRVDYLITPKEYVDTVLAELGDNRMAFAIEKVNEQMTTSLSENFDYIGIACSLIVFIFLWLSFRNLWLALIAFIPMMVSWIWILGAMHLLGIQFNIVNIILATFIFGQGDDYTIFMVEGLLAERNEGKQLLPQFKSEIILSALIMLVGIGVLVLARHPAMYSLGAVTLIGMSTVVLMSFVLPPLLFRLYSHIDARLHPSPNKYPNKRK